MAPVGDRADHDSDRLHEIFLVVGGFRHSRSRRVESRSRVPRGARRVLVDRGSEAAAFIWRGFPVSISHVESGRSCHLSRGTRPIDRGPRVPLRGGEARFLGVLGSEVVDGAAAAGRSLVTSSDRTISLHDLDRLEAGPTIVGEHDSQILMTHLNGGADSLVSGDRSGVIKLWSLASNGTEWPKFSEKGRLV